MPWEKPTKIYVDNSSTITLAKNPMFHDKSKHIDTKFHYHEITLQTRKLK
jgi:hypothetical protein